MFGGKLAEDVATLSGGAVLKGALDISDAAVIAARVALDAIATSIALDTVSAAGTCVCVSFAILDAASVAATCVAAGPVVVAMAKVAVAVLLCPVG